MEPSSADPPRFVLVHGGMHDAWCWHLLRQALHTLGAETIAMDLPVDEPGKGLDDYADAVLAAMPDGPAYVVGHSLGGFVAPRVALRREAVRVIFLCAGFPPASEAERSATAEAADPDNFTGMIRDDRDRITPPPELAIATFYPDVEPALAAEAASHIRPQWIGAFTDSSLIAPYADTVAAVIACSDDPIAPLAEQRIRAPRMFGIDPIVLPGGHSPFLSRPRDLARTLHRIALEDGRAPSFGRL